MALTSSTVVSTSQLPWELFAKGLSDIRHLVTCKICTRLMFEPYTTKCGHAFCYGCLSKWLNHGERRRQCPDCRTKVRDEPSPDYTIRHIVHVLLTNSSFLEDGDTIEILEEEQREQAKILETDRSAPNDQGLFNGTFKHRHYDMVRDASDGVSRCPSCNWEVEGGYCDRCDLDFDEDSLAGFSDYSYDSEFDLNEDDFSDEPDEDDEAFIDDRTLPTLSARNVLNVNLLSDDRSDDHLGTYTSPHELSSDSESSHLPEETVRFFSTLSERQVADLTRGDESLSGSEEESGGSSNIDAIDDDDDNGGDSGSLDSGNSEASDESIEQPIRQHRRIRQRERAPADPLAIVPRSNNRVGHTTPGGLTTLQNASSSHRQRRGHPVSTIVIRDSSSDESRTSTIRDPDQGEQKLSSEEESESDAPIPIRPRKRERIVLDDSDDEEEVVAQRETRARRRRMVRRYSTTEYSGENYRESTVTNWNREPSHIVSILPPGRNRSSLRFAPGSRFENYMAAQSPIILVQDV